MLAYCGHPSAASSGDRSSYIVPRYARVTIAGSCSLRGALATAIIGHTGSWLDYAAYGQSYTLLFESGLDTITA